MENGANNFKINLPSIMRCLLVLSLLLLSYFINFAWTTTCSSASAQNKEDLLFRNEDFVLHSLAFKPGEKIATKYTADGADISPPLDWINPPPSTVSYAVVVEDPDAPAGSWTHWIIYDIPGKKTGLREGIKPMAKLPDGSIQALNSFHKIGYGGPSPPAGSTHRYFFTLYALDTFSYSAPSFSAPETDIQKFRSFLNLHAKGKSKLMGIYGRR